MVLRVTRIFRYANGKPRKFYGCSEWQTTGCAGKLGAHPSGGPMGFPAKKENRAARIRAHQALDGLWKNGQRTREQAYHWMQSAMGMTKAQAHIGKFTTEQCEQLITLILYRTFPANTP